MSRLAKRLSSGKQGFTVLELLIVIGLITFMLSILGVVFLRAQENARRQSTQALIHRITIALSLYAGEMRGQGLPPDTGFGLPLAKTATYDSFSLWRYLGRPVTDAKGVHGPFMTFKADELTKVGSNYYVRDAWGMPIGYVGDPRRVLHSREADVFSCGADKQTARDYAWSGPGNPALAYDGVTKDAYGVTGGAALLGPATQNGTLTVALQMPLRPNENRDDHNNWDPEP